MYMKTLPNHKNYGNNITKLDLLFKCLHIYFKFSPFYFVQDVNMYDTRSDLKICYGI